VAGQLVLRRELLRLAERAAAALRSRGLSGRTIALKIRYPDFTTVTRSRTLADPTDSAPEVFAVASELLDAHLPRGMAVRLLGVRVEQLVRGVAAEQLTLDGGAVAGGANTGWPDAERAADAVRTRFGNAAVQLATLLEAPGRAGDHSSSLNRVKS
jgi:DNA polymerase-4